MNVFQKILALLMTIIQTIMALFGIRTAAQKTGDRETARAQELASAFYSTYYDKNTGVLRAKSPRLKRRPAGISAR